jgi:hypothetical protein
VFASSCPFRILNGRIFFASSFVSFVIFSNPFLCFPMRIYSLAVSLFLPDPLRAGMRGKGKS